ncbi:hypothetical protein [Rhizobium fabae]|uniref:Putative HTH transcriptional regulator n=1 Tax=Rhizobium fabae TaxID=573179 RepID=A0A7W6FJL6_9HYPH|nr:hypothetical protein [Rhizobium fabae]MBB3916192.1 putative HTH transcriptional regulator [Rhizobium fabae]
MFDLTGEPRPKNQEEVTRKMADRGFVLDNLEGRFDITNLGAIMLARDVTAFPSIAGKAVRIVKYTGRDKSRSDFEQEGKKGYGRCHVVSSVIEEAVDLRNQARAPVTAFHCAMARIRWMWVARAEHI